MLSLTIIVVIDIVIPLLSLNIDSQLISVAMEVVVQQESNWTGEV